MKTKDIKWDKKDNLLRVVVQEENVLPPRDVVLALQHLERRKNTLLGQLSEVNDELDRMGQVVKNNPTVFEEALQEFERGRD